MCEYNFTATKYWKRYVETYFGIHILSDVNTKDALSTTY